MEPVTIGVVGVGVAISSLVGTAFAIQQNHNHKKLTMITDEKVSRLEQENLTITAGLKESNEKLSLAISKVQSLESEVKNLRATITGASITDLAVAKRLTSLENKVSAHEDKLLNAARIALGQNSQEIKNQIMVELQPEISAIKQVEHELSNLKHKLRENGIKLESSLSPTF